MAHSIQLLCILALVAFSEAGFWGWSAPRAGFLNQGFLSPRNDKKAKEEAAPVLMRRADKQPRPVTQAVAPKEPPSQYVAWKPPTPLEATKSVEPENVQVEMPVNATDPVIPSYIPWKPPVLSATPTSADSVSQTNAIIDAASLPSVIKSSTPQDETNPRVPVSYIPWKPPALSEPPKDAATAELATPQELAMLDEDLTLHYSWEAKLIETMTDDGEEHARSCIAHCRYGEESRHSWTECIERCVKYDLTKRLLLAGLPADLHDAVHLEAEVPAGMDDLKKKKRKKRAEEL